MRLVEGMAAVGILCASTGMARADWEYTVWGMSPEEVIVASRGLAEPSVDRERDWQPYRAEVKAPYAWEGFTFTAYFLFGPEYTGLRYVSLVMENPHACPRLAVRLRQVYGTPVVDIEKPVFAMGSWSHTAENADLLLTFTKPAPPFCELRLARPGKRPH